MGKPTLWNGSFVSASVGDLIEARWFDLAPGPFLLRDHLLAALRVGFVRRAVLPQMDHKALTRTGVRKRNELLRSRNVRRLIRYLAGLLRRCGSAAGQGDVMHLSDQLAHLPHFFTTRIGSVPGRGDHVNLLGVRPDLVVEVAPHLMDEADGPMLRYGLQEMAGGKLLVPNQRAAQPDR